MGTERVTLASGLQISYAERGAGTGPPVLLLPGPTDAWRSYQPVLDRLPRDMRAIAISPRGHGDSDRPETGYAIEDFAGDVVAVLDALAVDRAVLAGHSGSCLVARRVALDHPERVAGLVLEASPTWLGGEPERREFVGASIMTLEDPIDAGFARSFVTDTSSANLPREFVDSLVDDVVRVPARVWREMFSTLLDYDDRARLADVAAPALLIWGDGDVVVPRAMQDELVDLLPEATLTVYPGVGHTPRWEEPGRFADDVAAFVARTAR